MRRMPRWVIALTVITALAVLTVLAVLPAALLAQDRLRTMPGTSSIRKWRARFRPR